MDQSSAIILYLLDEILLDILSRLSLCDLSSIPFVCRRFSNLLVNNPDFLRLRLIPTLHVFACNHDGDDGDDRSLISVSMPLNSSNWSTPIRLPLSLDQAQGYSFVTLGRSVYIIGNNHASRHDTWTETTVPIASPCFPSHERMDASAINGKLYAFTVVNGTTIKEYDSVADKWLEVCWCSEYDIGQVGVGVGGVFYLVNHHHDGFMKGYDVSAGQWVGGVPGPLPRPSWVCCACGTPVGHLYVISKFMEKVWFWRWEGSGGGWVELEPPMVPQTSVYIGRRSLQFRCVVVRNEMVVAAVNVAPLYMDDSFSIGMYILVYSVVDESWSRGPDLPIEFNSELTLAFTEY